MAACESGCRWNNKVAHAAFEDFLNEQGKEAAMQNLRQDVRSWIRERKGESFHWTYHLQGNDLIAENGKTIRELNANLLTGKNSSFADDSYKEVAILYDIPTLERAQELALQGKKTIIFPIHHKDNNGNIVAKYLNVWTQDEHDKTLYRGSSINLGKNFAIKEVTARIGTMVLGDAQITFHKAYQEHAFVLSAEQQGIEEVRKKLTTAVVAPCVSYGNVQADRSQQHIPAQQLHIDTQVLRPAEEHGVRRATTFVYDVPRMHEVPKSTADRLPLVIDREKMPTSVQEGIQAKHREMQKTVAALVVVAENQVAAGAIPLLVASLTTELPKSIKPIEKSIARHKKKEMKRMQKIKNMQRAERKQLGKKRREAVKNLTTQEGVVHAQQRNQEKRIAVKKKEFISRERKPWTISPRMKRYKSARSALKANQTVFSLEKPRAFSPRRFVQSVTIRKQESRIRIKKKEVLCKRLFIERPRQIRNKEQRKQKQHDRLVRVLGVIASKIHKTERQTKPVIEKPSITDVQTIQKQRLKKVEKKIDVQRFSFACLLFVLLHAFNSEKNNSELKKETSDTSELLGQQESTPWALLSIIWYLAMIREQGVIRHAPKKKKKKQSGVIFQRSVNIRPALHGMIWV